MKNFSISYYKFFFNILKLEKKENEMYFLFISTLAILIFIVVDVYRIWGIWFNRQPIIVLILITALIFLGLFFLKFFNKFIKFPKKDIPSIEQKPYKEIEKSINYDLNEIERSAENMAFANNCETRENNQSKIDRIVLCGKLTQTEMITKIANYLKVKDEKEFLAIRQFVTNIFKNKGNRNITSEAIKNIEYIQNNIEKICGFLFSLKKQNSSEKNQKADKINSTSETKEPLFVKITLCKLIEQIDYTKFNANTLKTLPR